MKITLQRLFRLKHLIMEDQGVLLQMKKMKNLAAFDFDHTIIELNSDVEIASSIPGGVPDNIKKLHRNDGWTAYMQGVFNTLLTHGYTREFIKNLIIKLDPVVGMLSLIEELSSKLNYDVIIISDSNSYFIDTWLQHNNLKQHVFKVFTNQAEFEGDLLKIEPFHSQDYCDLSSKNLCKGQILQDFLVEQKNCGVIYETILYAGDGVNDLCPILRLNKNDHAFARNEFKLVDLVEKVLNCEMRDKDGNTYEIKANIHHWNDALDILQTVKNIHCTIKNS